MKKLFMVIAGLLFSVSFCESSDLKGRFGIGANWPGLQVRYGITDNFLAEGKVQFASNNTTIGGRGYFLFNAIPGSISIVPYVGGEFDWVLSNVLVGGYLIGGFAGVEVLVTRNIGIGGDAGLFYANMWSTLGIIADYGILFNAGLTYYF